MQIRWRSNPKTPDGWFKRSAIALLAGLGVFAVAMPGSFFFFLRHFETAYPDDTQNLLSALTASVLTGLGLAAVVGVATLVASALYKRLGVRASSSV